MPLRETEPDSILITPAANNEPAADSIPYGTLLTDVAKREYIPGEWVTATFSAVNPRHVTALTLADDPRVEDYSYLLVQKQVGRDWVTVKTDTDPYTTIRCVRNGGLATGWQATVGWLLKGEDLSSGAEGGGSLLRRLPAGLSGLCQKRRARRLLPAVSLREQRLHGERGKAGQPLPRRVRERVLL